MKDTILQRHIGAVVVTAWAEYDNYGDSSWLGVFCNFRQPANKEEKLVHRESGSVLDHTGIWRDSRGRLVAAPDVRSHSREYQFTWHDNGHERIKYALQDSNRLEALDNGSWSFVGVVATVEIDGVELARDSLWGIESDSGDSYLAQTAREVAHEALGSAKGWVKRRLVA